MQIRFLILIVVLLTALDDGNGRNDQYKTLCKSACKNVRKFVTKKKAKKVATKRKSNFHARIVGGHDSPPRPFMALIKRTDMDFTCGGAVINDLFVLTAGHCVCMNSGASMKDIY